MQRIANKSGSRWSPRYTRFQSEIFRSYKKPPSLFVGAIFDRSRVSYYPFQRLMWLPSSLIPLFEIDTYDQLSLWLTPLWSVSSDPTLPWKTPVIFRGRSVDYGPKSICGTEWNLFEIIQDRNKGVWSIDRNHQSFGYSALIHGGSACLFLRQTRVHDAILLPVIREGPI